MAQVLEGSVRTDVDHVHCYSCRAQVSIGEVLEIWAEIARDLCPRCTGQLFRCSSE